MPCNLKNFNKLLRKREVVLAINMLENNVKCIEKEREVRLCDNLKG
jgi:hypothetical protein